MITALAFYAFATVLIASAAMVVTSRNPVHSVLFLILAFFNAAALFLIAGAEFLAMILVIVYVGAVAVLFLFVVMMLDVDFAELKAEMARYMPLALLIGLIVIMQLTIALGVWQVDSGATGRIAARYGPGTGLPALYARRRVNRGIEAMCYSAGTDRVHVLLQSPLAGGHGFDARSGTRRPAIRRAPQSGSASRFHASPSSGSHEPSWIRSSQSCANRRSSRNSFNKRRDQTAAG